MPTNQTNVMNAFEAVLSSEFGPSDLTMNIVEVAEFPQVPFYLVIDPLSENVGREYILFDGSASGTQFVTSTVDNRRLPRSLVGGGDTHPAGTIVRMSPMEQHIQDLNKRIEGRFRTSNHTKANHDSLGIAHSSLSGLSAGDPHTQYLDTSRHGALAHSDKLTIEPSGRKMTVGPSPHAGPQVHDIWIDTN